MCKQNPVLNAENKRRKKIIEDLGIKILGWTQGGSNHLKFAVELPNGIKKLLVCPFSGSDWRGEKNMTAMLKRWLKEAETA